VSFPLIMFVKLSFFRCTNVIEVMLLKFLKFDHIYIELEGVFGHSKFAKLIMVCNNNNAMAILYRLFFNVYFLFK